MISRSTTTTPFLTDDPAEGRIALDMPSDDEQDQEEKLPCPSRPSLKRFRFQTISVLQPPPAGARSRLSTALQIATYALAAWGLVALFLQVSSRASSPGTRYDVYRPSTLPAGLNLCDCGSTISDAVARGCTYDTLAAAWLPPACRDAELTALFDGAGPGPGGEWAYFLDEAGTAPLTTADLAALGGTQTKFWASRRWHVAHCLFYWHKLFRMRDTGVVMEERFDSADHIRHCSRLILNHVPLVDPDTGTIFLLDVPVMMNASTEAAKRAAKHPKQGGGHHG